MQEMWAFSLGWEDPLEKEMATHSVFLPGKPNRKEEFERLWSTGLQRVGHNESDLAHTHMVLPTVRYRPWDSQAFSWNLYEVKTI